MQHLAIIMDGNRRWVRKQVLAPLNSLDNGVTSLEAAVECCLSKKIPYLSVFALSVENLKRSDATLSDLYSLLNQKAETMAQRLAEKGVEMRFLGDRSLFNPVILESISRIESVTRGGTRLKLSTLFCYGGQQEILAAAQSIAFKVAGGVLRPEDVTAQEFESALWTAGTPPPDLIVRSGGAIRLSNFLLYQAAYAELVFLDALWPDITQQQLESVVDDFVNIQRNFGA